MRPSRAKRLQSGPWFAAAVCFVWIMLNLSHAHGATFTDIYDDEIRAAVKTYWADTYPDWKSGKAQLIAESRLDPNAVSNVGAEGLAQFMPGTFADISRQLGWGTVSPKIAKYAIIGYAYYMRQLRGQWSSPRPSEDREDLARSSYNAGTGWIVRAQRACGNAVLYAQIIACLPSITGNANAKQTMDYVIHIHRYRAML